MQGAAPVRQKLRRMSPKMFEFARDEVDKLLHSGIIEPSASDWRSAPVITWRDNKGRMCFDYRDFNKARKKDAYSIPNMDAIFEQKIYRFCVTRLRALAVHANVIRLSERAGDISEVNRCTFRAGV